MNTEQDAVNVSVELPLPFIHGLLALAHLMDAGITSALQAAINAHHTASRTQEITPNFHEGSMRYKPGSQDDSLKVEILGQQFHGTTLADLFAQCVDTIHDLDPSAIERLSKKKTHARRYVARQPADIHFKSPHLETVQTRSGWWISANVSEQQVRTAMRLLAEASDLAFGKDFLFPIKAPRRS